LTPGFHLHSDALSNASSTSFADGGWNVLARAVRTGSSIEHEGHGCRWQSKVAFDFLDAGPRCGSKASKQSHSSVYLSKRPNELYPLTLLIMQSEFKPVCYRDDEKEITPLGCSLEFPRKTADLCGRCSIIISKQIKVGSEDFNTLMVSCPRLSCQPLEF
jgi:hypothetical protein